MWNMNPLLKVELETVGIVTKAQNKKYKIKKKWISYKVIKTTSLLIVLCGLKVWERQGVKKSLTQQCLIGINHSKLARSRKSCIETIDRLMKKCIEMQFSYKSGINFNLNDIKKAKMDGWWRHRYKLVTDLVQVKLKTFNKFKCIQMRTIDHEYIHESEIGYGAWRKNHRVGIFPFYILSIAHSSSTHAHVSCLSFETSLYVRFSSFSPGWEIAMHAMLKTASTLKTLLTILGKL